MLTHRTRLFCEQILSCRFSLVVPGKMEMFNKIYSQVSTTVSQLSGVLPGNPVTREFEAGAHIASAGPGLVWKVFQGVKKSTKQEASIFLFEKRQLEKYNKNDREIILESLRRGIVQLTKIRHPKVLTVQHGLEESRESLAFATEPVFASLANILGGTFNMPQPANMTDYKLYDIEVKYGLLQVSEGLAFLHNDVKMLHKNICPESIVVNRQGAWKIFGFDFCVFANLTGQNRAMFAEEEFKVSWPKISQPNLDYLAPECGDAMQCPSSDMFSLGMLAFTLNSPTKKSLFPSSDFQGFKSRNQQIKNGSFASKLNSIPLELRGHVKLLLDFNPNSRPDAHQFIKISYFEDVGVKTLNYLDTLLQWDNLQKSQFYKGLPEALQKLPHRVKVQRVLHCLSRDLSQPAMVPFILPSILDIAQDCTQEEFVGFVLPHLKPLMKLLDPIQILLIFLQRMELLLKLTPAEDIQLHVLPMLNSGLDSDSPQIHELCLSVLPNFAGLLENSNVKNALLPRIKRLCLATSTLSVRVNCLLCIGRLLEFLDKWLVLDEILPFLPQIPSREPAVLMGIIGIYKLAMNHKKLGISKEIMASRVLPFLIPLCIENGLTLAQFNSLVTLVKEMFEAVEKEHRIKLTQLNSVKDEQKVLEATMPSILPVNSSGIEDFMAMNSPKKAPSVVQSTSFPSLSLNKAPQANYSSLNLHEANSTNNFPSLSLKAPIVPQKNFASLSLHEPVSVGNSPNNFDHFSSGNNFNNSFSGLNASFSNNMNSFSSSTFQSSNNSFANSSSSTNNSSLDFLLPDNTPSKVSINQMRNAQHSNNNIRSGPSLSNDDIMDLLS